jgi:predicted translin family RNA/ssDNA-binding protein
MAAEYIDHTTVKVFLSGLADKLGELARHL